MQAPIIGVILSIIAIIVLIFASVVWVRRQYQKTKNLTAANETLSAKINELEAYPSSQKVLPAQEAYLEFIANLSHEVSNPLQSIQINLDNLASNGPEETGHWRQSLTMISAEVKRLFTLTENLRLLSHLENTDLVVKRESVNLKSVIEDVIMAEADRAANRQILLNYRGPERPARVLGNRGQLHQVVSNLVDNSIKYAKESGGAVAISLQEDADRILVRVSDEGIGISEVDLPYVFDTAYRAPAVKSVKRTGSGLGLAIAKRVVEQHGGEIKVQSQAGEGTTVTFTVPVYRPDR
jgi:signal transduction histidine kinase